MLLLSSIPCVIIPTYNLDVTVRTNNLPGGRHPFAMGKY